MIRMLHVTQATTEGVGRYVADLVRDQAARGWEVALACPRDAELASVCEASAARYERWDANRSPGPSSLGEVRRLRRIIRAVDPQIVHLHSSKAGLAGRLALRRSRPTLFSPHAWSFLHGGSKTRRLALSWERTAARWTDVFLCVSEAERRRGVDARINGEWSVVPNGVDLDEFAPADPRERATLRSSLGLSSPTVVCVGRLAPQKGQDVLIAAWPKIRSAVPTAALVLVGDGPDKVTLERAVPPDLGVRFVGSQSDVRAWLAASDIAAQPSRWEGMSMVALEALASGASLVASDVDGMAVVVGRGTDAAGCLVPPDDSDALATAIIERLRHPDLASTEGERARRRAADFSLEIWGDRVAAVVTTTLQSKR
jgi:glycosyltransferase involved in cell wall biosynthesis